MILKTRKQRIIHIAMAAALAISTLGSIAGGVQAGQTQVKREAPTGHVLLQELAGRGDVPAMSKLQANGFGPDHTAEARPGPGDRINIYWGYKIVGCIDPVIEKICAHQCPCNSTD